MSRPLRVAQCYTGGVGSEIVRRLAGNPQFDLVGALVHDDSKVGRDVGDIAGIGGIGVTATQSLDEIIDLRPDAAVWMGQEPAGAELRRLLTAGVNVYTAPECGGYYFDVLPDRDEYEEASRRGGASIVSGGNIPGLVSDALPLFVSGFSVGMRGITAIQHNHVADYPSAMQIGFGLGMGKPLLPENDEDAGVEAQVDGFWEWLLDMSAAMVARGLDIPYSGVRTRCKEKAPAPVTTTLAASGLHVAAGTQGGVRWTWDAYSGDSVFLTVINEQTAVYGLGDGWRRDESAPAWTVSVDGEPPIEATITWPRGTSAARANVQLNAARAINLLRPLVAAAPGCRSLLDLPLTTCTDVRL